MGAGARVLVVAADRLAAAAMVSVLRGAGHECTAEYDARAAVRAIVRGNPQVVVIDLSLPDGDGPALLERLGLIGGAGRAVVAISPSGRRERWLDAGADVVLIGDLDRAALVESVVQARSQAGGVGRAARTEALALLSDLGAGPST